MQNTGWANGAGGASWQPSYGASTGYAYSIPKPYMGVSGGANGGGSSGTYQPANGTNGVVRGYCSPLVSNPAPKPSGLESSVTKTNIATFVVSSHPNSAVRGLCVPANANTNSNSNGNGSERNKVEQFSSQFSPQPVPAACASGLQPNYATPDASAYLNEHVNMRTSVSNRAVNVAPIQNGYCRTTVETVSSPPPPPPPPRPAQSHSQLQQSQSHQQQQDQCDVQSLIERFEKLNAFNNEFGILSNVAPVGSATAQSQLDRGNAVFEYSPDNDQQLQLLNANLNAHANNMAINSVSGNANFAAHLNVSSNLASKTHMHENDTKSWNAKHQAVATYSVRSSEVVKPQPQTALPLQTVQRDANRGNTPTVSAQNHVTFASANVSRAAAPLASRTTNAYPHASSTSGSVNANPNTRANVSTNAATDRTCEYDYELRRIDCDNAPSKPCAAEETRGAAITTITSTAAAGCASGNVSGSVNAQTVRSAGQNCSATSACRSAMVSPGQVGAVRSSKPGTETWQNVPNPTACATGSSPIPAPVSAPVSAQKTSGRSTTTKRSSVSVLRTHYPPALFRLFMEQHVEHLFRLRQERLERRAQLEREMAQMGFDESQKAGFRRMLIRRESDYTRLRRIKLSARDFEIIKLIGVGAFGKVFLVHKCASQQPESALEKSTGEPALSTQLFAMKKLNKAELTRKNQLGHVKAERDILAESDNEWVVKLYYSFQDARYLYFILEYVPGGDLMSLLIRMGIFPEDLARFYVAELILAVESVHAMRFIHRDIKPDNILICADGHLKLTDFGLCTGFRWTHSSKFYQAHMGEPKRAELAGDLESTAAAASVTDKDKPKPKLLEERARANERAREMRVAYSLVGTPNYIAPEVLLRCGYTETVDWWSIGVILYEMLVGQPPFWATTPAATQFKVINHKSNLRFPSDGRLSSSALSLIRALVRDPPDRLGRNGADEIKSHSFFEPLRKVAPFEQLRHLRAPWKPVITHPTDTSNFDPIDEETLRMLSDTETDGDMRDGDVDNDANRKRDSDSPFEDDSTYEGEDSQSGDCATLEQRSASCETLNVIETDETANVTLSSVLDVGSLIFAKNNSLSDSDSDSNSSNRDLSSATSAGRANAHGDVTQRADTNIGTGRESRDARKRKEGRSGKSKMKSKQIADESRVIPPAPYLDFTFRRFFDEPDTQRRASSVQSADNGEYFENFV